MNAFQKRWVKSETNFDKTVYVSLQNHTVEKKWAFPRKKLQNLKNLVTVILLKFTTDIDGANNFARHPSSFIYIISAARMRIRYVNLARKLNHPSHFFQVELFGFANTSVEGLLEDWVERLLKALNVFTQTFILGVFFIVWWILSQIFSPLLLPNSSLCLFGFAHYLKILLTYLSTCMTTVYSTFWTLTVNEKLIFLTLKVYYNNIQFSFDKD